MAGHRRGALENSVSLSINCPYGKVFDLIIPGGGGRERLIPDNCFVWGLCLTKSYKFPHLFSGHFFTNSCSRPYFWGHFLKRSPRGGDFSWRVNL